MRSEEVDRYLATLDEPKRSTLTQLRATIVSIVPDAEEGLSYGSPAYGSTARRSPGSQHSRPTSPTFRTADLCSRRSPLTSPTTRPRRVRCSSTSTLRCPMTWYVRSSTPAYASSTARRVIGWDEATEVPPTALVDLLSLTVIGGRLVVPDPGDGGASLALRDRAGRQTQLARTPLRRSLRNGSAGRCTTNHHQARGWAVRRRRATEPAAPDPAARAGELVATQPVCPPCCPGRNSERAASPSCSSPTRCECDGVCREHQAPREDRPWEAEGGRRSIRPRSRSSVDWGPGP